MFHFETDDKKYLVLYKDNFNIGNWYLHSWTKNAFHCFKKLLVACAHTERETHKLQTRNLSFINREFPPLSFLSSIKERCMHIHARTDLVSHFSCTFCILSITTLSADTPRTDTLMFFERERKRRERGVLREL